MGFLLDTGILIHIARDSVAFRAIDEQLGLIRGDFRPIISIVSEGEVRAFAARRGWGPRAVNRLSEILEGMLVIPIDQPSQVTTYARLEAVNTSSGLNVGQNDLWIAATAVDYGLVILTFDDDFSRLPDVEFIRCDQNDGSIISRRP